MRNIITSLIGMVGATAFYVISIGMLPGWVFWLWMAIQFGSFWMFLFAFVGPLGIVAAILGLWSLLFGIPGWLLHMVI